MQDVMAASARNQQLGVKQFLPVVPGCSRLCGLHESWKYREMSAVVPAFLFSVLKTSSSAQLASDTTM